MHLSLEKLSRLVVKSIMLYAAMFSPFAIKFILSETTDKTDMCNTSLLLSSNELCVRESNLDSSNKPPNPLSSMSSNVRMS